MFRFYTSFLEAKEHLVNRLNITDEQKKEVQELVNKYPQKASKIDWNKKDLSYDYLMSILKELSKQDVKKGNVSGLVVGKDYLDFSRTYKGNDILAYVPLNYEASRILASKSVGGITGEWCISYQKDPEHWMEYTYDGNIIFLFLVIRNHKFAVAIPAGNNDYGYGNYVIFDQHDSEMDDVDQYEFEEFVGFEFYSIINATKVLKNSKQILTKIYNGSEGFIMKNYNKPGLLKTRAHTFNETQWLILLDKTTMSARSMMIMLPQEKITPKIFTALLNNYGVQFIKYMKQPPTEEQMLEAVKDDGRVIGELLKYNPSITVIKEAIKEDNSALDFIPRQNDEMQLFALKNDVSAIVYFKNPSRRVQLAITKAIKDYRLGTNIYVIARIANPIPELVNAALERSPLYIRYIQTATDEMWIKAIRSVGKERKWLINELKKIPVWMNQQRVNNILSKVTRPKK